MLAAKPLLYNTEHKTARKSGADFIFTCSVERFAASELDRSILPISDCGEAMLPLQYLLNLGVLWASTNKSSGGAPCGNAIETHTPVDIRDCSLGSLELLLVPAPTVYYHL